MTDVVNEVVEELKNPETFDLGAVLRDKVKYPTRDVQVFLDADLALELLERADEIADKSAQAESLRKQADTLDALNGSIIGDEESPALRIQADALDKEAEAETAELQELGEKLHESSLTFTLRGVAPKLWRVLDSKWRREIPIRKDADEVEQREDNITRNEKVTIDCIRAATVKITTGTGAVSGQPTFEQVEHLYETIMESEWFKLKERMEQLTFANALFKEATVDADFLPQSSAGEATEDTSAPSE